jgi:hypothetical protein
MTDVLDELAKEFTQILRTETTSVTAVPAARDALAAILAHKDGASWRADVITSAAKRLGWDYRRDTEGGLVCFTFYGQGQHFEGVKHEICQVQILPDRVRFSRRFEFSKSSEDVEADYQARGHDPALVDSPALHPYGLPEEDDMLPAAVIVAADHQYRVIVERLREELAKAEQERDTAVTQEATAGGNGQGNNNPVGPQLGTEGNIHLLIKYREEAIERDNSPPGRTAACKKVGMDNRTVKKAARELWLKWKDTDYRPKPYEFDGGNW